MSVGTRPSVMLNVLWFCAMYVVAILVGGLAGATAAYFDLPVEAPFGFSFFVFGILVWLAGTRHANRGAPWDHDTRHALAVGYTTAAFVLSIGVLVASAFLLKAFDPLLLAEIVDLYADAIPFFAIAMLIGAALQFVVARLVLRFAVRPAHPEESAA